MDLVTLYIKEHPSGNYSYYKKTGEDEYEKIDTIMCSPHDFSGYDPAARKEISARIAHYLQTCEGVVDVRKVDDEESVWKFDFIVEEVADPETSSTIKLDKKKREEPKMAKKKVAKKKVAKKKVAAKKKDDKKETMSLKKDKGRKPGVGQFVKEKIKAGWSKDKIEKAVKEKFPQSKYSSAHYSWYINDMRGKGEIK